MKTLTQKLTLATLIGQSIITMATTPAFAMVECWFHPNSKDCVETQNSPGAALTLCSAERIESNLQLVDQNMLAISQSPEFERATEFKSTINKLNQEKAPETKVRGYMSLIDVNPDNDDELVKFIGARDLSPYIAVFEHKTNLTPEQSSTVVQTIAKSLRANLNRKR